MRGGLTQGLWTPHTAAPHQGLGPTHPPTTPHQPLTLPTSSPPVFT